MKCQYDEIGKHMALKMPRLIRLVGSSPTTDTNGE